MAKTPESVGIYCRLSFAPDGSEEKVDRQEVDCRQVGDRLAWPINENHIYRDNNRSAWQRNRKRPGWDAMLAAIEAGEIDAIIIYHGDRLIRQPYDLEKLINTADSKGTRIASPSGTRDLDNADDRYILRIEAAGFCRASDDSSRRIKRAQKDRRAKGLPRTGGSRAFGFERDNITHRPSETAVLAEAGERLLAGQSMYGVFQWANTVSTTTTGGRWRLNTLRDTLCRPRIAGLIERDGDLHEAAWDPIMPVEMWQDLRALLKDRGAKYSSYQPTAHEYAVRYLLSGIARCGTCGSGMEKQLRASKKMQATGKQVRDYLCGHKGCPYRVSRSMANLDAYVIGRVLQVLNDPAFVARLYANQEEPGVAADLRALERRKAEAKNQLENLADFPEIDAGMVARSLASFDRKITKLRDARASTARQRLLARMAGTTREQWDQEPLDIRRTTVAALFHIEVLRVKRKGRGFDPTSVKMTPITA